MMPSRTVSEWITVARVSRGTGHLFCEGPSDARILEHAFDYPNNIDFREASQIDCDMSEATALCGGNKFRLISLADKSAIGDCENIKCFVDSDFSIYCRDRIDIRNLFETFPCANLPAMTFTFDWLKGVLKKAYGLVLDASLFEFIDNTLRFAFVARYISATSDKHLAAASISDFVSYKSKMFVFDRLKYLNKFFAQNADKSKHTEKSIIEHQAMITSDLRAMCNSNDLFDILFVVLRKTGKLSGSANTETIRQVLLGAFDEAVLQVAELQPLLHWFKSFEVKIPP